MIVSDKPLLGGRLKKKNNDQTLHVSYHLNSELGTNTIQYPTNRSELVPLHSIYAAMVTIMWDLF